MRKHKGQSEIRGFETYLETRRKPGDPRTKQALGLTYKLTATNSNQLRLFQR